MEIDVRLDGIMVVALRAIGVEEGRLQPRLQEAVSAVGCQRVLMVHQERPFPGQRDIAIYP